MKDELLHPATSQLSMQRVELLHRVLGGNQRVAQKILRFIADHSDAGGVESADKRGEGNLAPTGGFQSCGKNCFEPDLQFLICHNDAAAQS